MEDMSKEEGGRTPEAVMASRALLPMEGAFLSEGVPRLSPSVGEELRQMRAVQYVPDAEKEWGVPLQLPGSVPMIRREEEICPSPLLPVVGTGGVEVPNLAEESAWARRKLLYPLPGSAGVRRKSRERISVGTRRGKAEPLRDQAAVKLIRVYAEAYRRAARQRGISVPVSVLDPGPLPPF